MMLCRKFWLQNVASGFYFDLSSEIGGLPLVRSLSGGESDLFRVSGFLFRLTSFRLDKNREHNIL